MQLTVIGCAGSFPNPSSPASCYLVQHEGASVVLDLGNGAVGPLAAHIGLDEITAVLLSHLHPDHCLDLTSLHVARTYHPAGPVAGSLPVHGPVGTRDRIAAAHRSRRHESVRGLDSTFSFVDHQPGPVRIGPFSVTTTRVVHPVEAYAIRISAGGSTLVYSGDTGPCQALVELARGADLALFEASFLDGETNPAALHLTAREAAEHASAAGVGRLVLTHLVAWNDQGQTLAEGRGAFGGELALAAPGMVVQV